MSNKYKFNFKLVNKAIEDGRYDIIFDAKSNTEHSMTIGQYIDKEYQKNDLYTKYSQPKVTKQNSIFFEEGWISVYKEENLQLPFYQGNTDGYGEVLERLYPSLKKVKKSLK